MPFLVLFLIILAIGAYFFGASFLVGFVIFFTLPWLLETR
jgi:hypothetical protein